MNTLKRIDSLKEEILLLSKKTKNIKELNHNYKIKYIYTSNALEGNSLTETETKLLIEKEISIGGKPLREHLEVIGHHMAYEEFIKNQSIKSINQDIIKKLHNAFYSKIDANEAGKYRKSNIYFAETKRHLPNPERLSTLMKNYISQLKEIRKRTHPIEYAAIAHKELVTIHPFIDGNGRVSRLIMNIILSRAGYALTIIEPEKRKQYLNYLQTADQGDSSKFIKFITEVVYDSQLNYLKTLKENNQILSALK